MPRRTERIERTRAVQREHSAAEIASDLLAARLAADPSSLVPHNLNPPDYVNLRENLAATYLIRMFAEFEAGIRDAWANAFHRPTHPQAAPLIDSIAGRCYMPQDWLDEVHRVRECRNAQVHEGEPDPTFTSLADARQSLCRFFSMLPLDW